MIKTGWVTNCLLLDNDVVKKGLLKPVEEYKKAGINWKNPLVRCNREKAGKKVVPVIENVEDFGGYDTVCLGFSI